MTQPPYFGNASGESLKFKLIGLETKCSVFKSKMNSAAVYMFKLLGSSFAKKQIAFDPLQCYITFKPNFPVNVQSEAQAVSALINTGYPRRKAFEQLPWVDDVEEIMELIEEEKSDIPDLEEVEDDDKDVTVNLGDLFKSTNNDEGDDE